MSLYNTSTITREYMIKLFDQGRRFDGRGLLDLKPCTIEHGVSKKAEGSARVIMGKTEVIAGVKLEVGTPYPDSPDAGNLTVSGDLLPVASPHFESGPPTYDGIETPRLVDRLIRESGMLDLKKLNIKIGEKVWTVYIDIYPINDDGSLMDASSLAAVVALKDAVLPKLKENGYPDYENKSKDKLPLNNILPLSFTFFKLGNHLLLQPTREEEEICEAKINFGLSKMANGSLVINSCQKGREVPFTGEEISKIAKLLPSLYEKFSHQVFKK